MTSTTFVEYKNYGFWAHDSFLVGLLFLFIKELKATDFEDDWKYKIIDNWSYAYLSGFPGNIPIGLDEKIDDDERKKLVVSILQGIVKKIEENAGFLTAEELNKNFVGGRRMKWEEINNEGFLTTARLMIELLEGRMKTDASSPITYLKY